MTPRPTFTRMDRSTADQWAEIGRQTTAHQPRVSRQRSWRCCVRWSRSSTGSPPTSCCIAARRRQRAERAGADDEVVIAALCHDVGKAVSVPNHGAIAAEMLRPYVRADVYHMVGAHQDFQGRYYYQHFGKSQDLRTQHRGEPWYDLTATFTDEWDQLAFDPDYDTLPLDHFEGRLREVFAEPRY